MALGSPSGALLSYEHHRDLPDDRRRYERLDGALVVTPTPGGRHRVVVRALYRLLWAARAPGTTVLVSPIDFVPSPETVLQPDLVVEDQETGTAPRDSPATSATPSHRRGCGTTGWWTPSLPSNSPCSRSRALPTAKPCGSEDLRSTTRPFRSRSPLCPNGSTRSDSLRECRHFWRDAISRHTRC